MSSDFIEYRVRPVTRYIVTRYNQADGGRSQGCESWGEFDNAERAGDVMHAMARQEKNPFVVFIGGDGDKQPNQCLADVLGLFTERGAVASADPALVTR